MSSQLLLNLLSGKNNIAHLLPKKFVFDLLRRRKGSYLNLKPDAVVDVFMSIEDPLVIVSSRTGSPKIHAPCAINVDLKNTKEEIMSILFSRKPTPCVQNSSNNDGCGMMPQATCSITSPDTNLDVNCLSGEAKILVARALSDLKALSSTFDTSRQNMDYSVVMKSVHGAVEKLQSIGPKINNFLNRSVINQKSTFGKVVLVESSSSCSRSTSKVKETETGADSLVEVVFGKQSRVGNTQDAKNKKGKGKSKGDKVIKIKAMKK